ncbi:MAG TPA: YegP family protein [Usitatibacter sp.]|nr:YegP family protein [Usitatibacter sp.]
MNGKFVLNLVGTSEFHWSLRARDAQTMLSSRIYDGKAAADTAIESCRINSQDDARYERLSSNDARYYFVLKTANGELLGTSEIYPTLAAREKGIALCKESAPSAKTAYIPVR